MLIPSLRTSLFFALPLAMTGLVLSACGGSDESTTAGNGSGNGNGTQGGTGNSHGNGGPPDLDVGDVESAGQNNGNGSVTPITPDQACATSSATADAIPAVVQMVVDTSGSMEWAPGTEETPPWGEPSKWEITADALKEAVAELPGSVAVGLSFYPDTYSDLPCIRNRIALPIRLLGDDGSSQRRDFEEAIDDASPQGGTPTHAAFVFGTETVAASALEGRKFVLLITDGVPTYTLECGGDGLSAVDSSPLIQAAGEAFGGAEAISTFVIGSPGSEAARGDLSKVAMAGGTATPGCSDTGPDYCHLDMTTAGDFASALAAGLQEIAGRIGTCEYAVPDAPGGKTINPQQVNVLYTKGDGAMASIPQDATGKCESGWVYDDPAAPSKITLCGSDCDLVKQDQGAKIDVIFGCDTQTNVPVK